MNEPNLKETALGRIQQWEENIKTELNGLKQDFEKTLNETKTVYEAIRKYDPTYDLNTVLAQIFGGELGATKDAKTTQGKRKPKIGTVIAQALAKEGMKEQEILKAVPNQSPDKIKTALAKVKSKPGARDSFTFKDGKFYPK